MSSRRDRLACYCGTKTLRTSRRQKGDWFQPKRVPRRVRSECQADGAEHTAVWTTVTQPSSGVRVRRTEQRVPGAAGSSGTKARSVSANRYGLRARLVCGSAQPCARRHFCVWRCGIYSKMVGTRQFRRVGSGIGVFESSSGGMGNVFDVKISRGETLARMTMPTLIAELDQDIQRIYTK
jgi:hypothetical protein